MNDLINVKQFVTMTRCLKLASDIWADEYRVCFSLQQFFNYNVLRRFFIFLKMQVNLLKNTKWPRTIILMLLLYGI